MFNPASRMEALPFSEIRVMMEKATQMQKNGEDVIHMEIGRPDFDTPEVIKQAAYKSLENGNVFYTSNYGTPELRQAIADKLKRDNGVDYKAEEILVTIGVGEGTYAAVAAFTEPGDEILVPDPVWLNYIHVPHFFGAVPVSYALKEENDYQIDLDQIESLITPKTKMLVINTPGNPTGVVQSYETLEKLADIAKKHNLIVVSDEIYEKLVYDGAKHVSIAALPGMKERTITLNGFSKCYSMTGWRLGYVAAPVEFIKAMVRVHAYINTCAPSFVQEAGITALEKAEPDVQEMVKEYQRRRDYTVSAINAIDGLSCKTPGGAFYIFVNIKSLGRSSAEVADYILEHAKVAAVPGSAFGPEGEGYIRLSYACSYERIVEAMERIKKAIAQLKG
ncbi:pyridoxal phosphate-dependent aminotransferase [Pseudoflavonifractor sp. 60]|uniref:pyridoxal phosphate-dependent aminotransferase n=1 Tax=Pseudoflavonifractor sp. 60 TaxID=2304576 RepID=UPI00136F4B81|nr:pyridoxal phosphate-dependent aminotransferase [Pseudoflavonifractor sp. 60]NBI68172.1 pyridoxal phosphate-dependent aminotransferase [Pseudoflavonifractor sp. 60]